MKITFKKFDRDFREEYGIKGNYSFRTEEDFKEVLFRLYGSENFSINYQDKTIIIN